MNKFKLTEKLEMVLLEGPKYSGNYKFPEALGPYEEGLTLKELKAAKLFLEWIVAKDLTYGHGNLRKLWTQWSLASTSIRNGTTSEPIKEDFKMTVGILTKIIDDIFTSIDIVDVKDLMGLTGLGPDRCTEMLQIFKQNKALFVRGEEHV